MRKWVASSVVLVCVAVGLVGSGAASAASGHSDTAKRCQKDGWQSWYTRDGQPFQSSDACTSYGVKGQLIPVTALSCLDGGWASLSQTAGGDAFTDEQACVDFAIGGGAPQPTRGADISVAYNAVTGAFTLSNAGPVTATVAIQSSGGTGLSVCSLSFTVDPLIWTFVVDPNFGPVFTSVVQAGQTVGGVTVTFAYCSEGLVGIQVRSSDQPDPDSTPGNHDINEDDFAVIYIAAP